MEKQFVMKTYNNTGDVKQVPIDDLQSFRNHTFHVQKDDEMQKLMDSIRNNGIMEPIVAFINEEGVPEIISGHRRHWVATQLGFDMVPVVLKDTDRDTATLMMGEANLMHRKTIRPSEKAYTYRSMLKALCHSMGRTEEGRFATEEATSSILAERIGESRTQMYRFIRLTELIPDLLTLVDAGKMGLRPAVELSYLSDEYQAFVFACYEEMGVTPSAAKAKEMHRLFEQGQLSESRIKQLLAEQTGGLADRENILTLHSPILMAHLSGCCSLGEKEARLIRGLKLLEEKERGGDYGG